MPTNLWAGMPPTLDSATYTVHISDRWLSLNMTLSSELVNLNDGQNYHIFSCPKYNLVAVKMLEFGQMT